MNFRDGRGPVSVQIPQASDDNPSWVRVAVVAALGFGVGVVWPRLAGVRIGPSAPTDIVAATTAVAPAQAHDGRPPVASGSSNHGTTSASAGAGNAVASGPSAGAAAPNEAGGGGNAGAKTIGESAVANAAAAQGVAVGRATVVSCRTAQGETFKGAATCGRVPGMDALVSTHLQRLSQCAAADGIAGKVPVVVAVDFASGKVRANVSKTFVGGGAEGITRCVRSAMADMKLAAVDHEHPRYILSYPVVISGHGRGADGAAASGQSAAKVADKTNGSGASAAAMVGATASRAEPVSNPTQAAILWEVAVVRDAPRTGQVVGRLQRGAAVQLGRVQDGWYKVNFGAGMATEGWVYRGAIGR